MIGPRVMAVGFFYVDGSAEELAQSFELIELAGLIQMDMSGAQRIPRQLCLGDRDAVHGVPFFGAQIEQSDLDTGIFCLKS